MNSWDVPQAAKTLSWTRPPTSSAGAGKGISEHTPAQAPVCPGSRTPTLLLCPGFLSEAPGATAPSCVSPKLVSSARVGAG